MLLLKSIPKHYNWPPHPFEGFSQNINKGEILSFHSHYGFQVMGFRESILTVKHSEKDPRNPLSCQCLTSGFSCFRSPREGKAWLWEWFPSWALQSYKLLPCYWLTPAHLGENARLLCSLAREKATAGTNAENWQPSIWDPGIHWNLWGLRS